jgi:predicted dehydrogenase
MSGQRASGGAPTRREFLKTTAVAGTALAANLSLLSNVHAAGDDIIKVGLIGCGGRGTGAIDNVLHSARNVKIVALADIFKDRLDSCRHRALELANDAKVKELGNSVDVTDDTCFVGFDAYEKVMKSDVNYIMLATPPGFRPTHIEAAVAAGKNLFTEKPVGTDGPSIRRVLAAYEESKKKGLHIVAGTQRRHEARYLETMKHIHDGAIGEIITARCYWNQGGIWAHARKDDWNDMVYQLRNWYHFTWLCGDHIVEQHVHNLDVVNWALGHHPLAAHGMGGRQVQIGPEYGQSWDHFAVEYVYPNNVHVLSLCRQIPDTEQSISEALHGTKGFCQVDASLIRGETNWQREKNEEDVDPYVQEHTDLIESIRSGKPINELKQVAESTLTAIMGRMSAYTGKPVKWEKALSSMEDNIIWPEKIDWEVSLQTPPVAMPGRTKLREV